MQCVKSDDMEILQGNSAMLFLTFKTSTEFSTVLPVQKMLNLITTIGYQYDIQEQILLSH